MHRGMLHAIKDGRLCVMDARHFQSIVNQFEHPTFDPKGYALDYVRQLNMCQACGIPITDLAMGDGHQVETDSAGTVGLTPKPALVKQMLTNILTRASFLGAHEPDQDEAFFDRSSLQSQRRGTRRSVLFGNDKAQAKAEEFGKQRASVSLSRGGF
mmetsp:Transcript_51785/g.92166  ORF Transcript_51785/g.92166 Transcript_51785/m.92166 type:complete len:156 (+) Transcript_51785:3-470(+)